MKVKSNSKFSALFLTFLSVSLIITNLALADPPGWKIIHIIRDEGITDLQISGSNVAWASGGEIFFWDGTTITQVTDNNFGSDRLRISGSKVVWSGWDGNDYEIFFWDADDPCNVTQITDNDYEDGFLSWGEGLPNVQISGSNVVWASIIDDAGEIFFWDGNTTTQITHNSIWNDQVQVSGTNVVWAGYPSVDNFVIFLWNGTTTIKIPDSNHGEYPQISGSNVVWQGSDVNPGSDIYFWNGSTTTQIFNNSYNNNTPQISGSNVVWWGGDGNDCEIFFWNGTTTQVTDNSYNDTYPKICGSNVVWASNSGDILFWDGITTTQLTSSGGSPQISGSSVVWAGYTDLYLGVKCISPPSTDFSDDCKVIFDDFAILADDWQITYSIEDLGDMASQWLECGYEIQGVCW